MRNITRHAAIGWMVLGVIVGVLLVIVGIFKLIF